MEVAMRAIVALFLISLFVDANQAEAQILTKADMESVADLALNRTAPLLNHYTESFLEESLGTTVQLLHKGARYEISVGDLNIPIITIVASVTRNGHTQEYRMVDLGATGKVSAVFTLIDNRYFVDENVPGCEPVNLHDKAFWQSQFDHAVKMILEYKQIHRKT